MIFVLVMVCLPVFPVQASGLVYRVKPGGLVSGTCGQTWEAACSLQYAISQPASGNQIWVAAGTYKPTSTIDRTISFVLKSGVAIYGGFAGTEDELIQRDPIVNVTLLSGDIGVLENNSDNSYHVVYGYQLNDSSILDGLTITGGNANGVKPYDRGGGMYNYLSNPTLTNVIFSNNYTVYLGGGMFNQNSNTTLTNVTFSNNTSAFYGAGIYNYYCDNPSLTDVIFSGNSAQQRGGGLYNYEGSATLSNVTFDSNSAQELGGGMNSFSSDLTLTNVTFLNNTAAVSGGGMYSGGGNLSLTNVTFTGNSANGGGGMLNSTISSGILVNVTFDGNSGLERAGGMYNYLSDPVMTDVTFTNNTAQQHGGGIFNSGSDPTMNNVVFSNNTSGIYGGGMDNSGGTPTLTDVTFANNTAVYGGGIYNWDYSSPSLTNVTFSNNSASARGGGIYSIYANNMMLTNVTFTGNTSQAEGAGMFTSASNPTLKRVSFIANTTLSHGGGMYNSYTHATLTDVTFSGNTAINGGGLNNNNSDPIMTNVTFSGNSAQERGGGLYNYSSDPTLNNVTFVDNTAQTYGGGIFNSVGSLMLNNATLADNTAGVYGGGIALDETNTSINNAIFWGNTAGNSGPQIFSFHSGMPKINDSVIEDGCSTGGVCTNIITTDPRLGTLGDNGGFTQTIPLLKGSSAIDKASDATCPSLDQRGVTRPQGSHCDIGAFEALIPGTFSKVNPLNGTLNGPANPTLKWGASANVVKYEYCIDTSANNTCNTTWFSTASATSVALSGLTPATYSWQVRAWNPTGMTKANGGTWWTFTVPPKPGAFSKTTPKNGAINRPTTLSLFWEVSSNVVKYEYCLDKVDNGVCDTSWISKGLNTSVPISGLIKNTKYYWQVRARNINGISFANGGVWWNFTTAP